MPRKWREKQARKNEIARGYCIKRDLKIVGEEWRKRATDIRNWRLERSETE